MYTVIDTINLSVFDGLKAEKILDLNAKEIISITLEKNATFPKHTSPTDAHLLVLEGEISFFINDVTFNLKTHQVFDFPKDKEHWVEAIDNSKFLIIR